MCEFMGLEVGSYYCIEPLDACLQLKLHVHQSLQQLQSVYPCMQCHAANIYNPAAGNDTMLFERKEPAEITQGDTRLPSDSTGNTWHTHTLCCHHKFDGYQIGKI